jgi:hypothetical protein
LEYNKTGHQLLIDFKKAYYDSVRRELFYNTLIKVRVPMKLGRLIIMCVNEIYNEVHRGKHLSDDFPIQNVLKQGIATSFQLYFSTCHCEGPGKPGGTEDADLNLLGDNIDAIKINTKALIDARKEVGLEINVEKIKYKLLSHHQNAGQNRDIKIAIRSFENV